MSLRHHIHDARAPCCGQPSSVGGWGGSKWLPPSSWFPFNYSLATQSGCRLLGWRLLSHSFWLPQCTTLGRHLKEELRSVWHRVLALRSVQFMWMFSSDGRLTFLNEFELIHLNEWGGFFSFHAVLKSAWMLPYFCLFPIVVHGGSVNKIVL